MVFSFFKSRRSAHSKKKDDKTTGQTQSTSIDRPPPFPNPLALNPPNRLHWIPKPKGQEETARIVSGDLAATADLSNVITRAGRLTKIVPELNTGGLVATERLLKTGGADDQAVVNLIADQARAQERLRARRGKRNASMQVLPSVTHHRVGTVPKLPSHGGSTTRKPSFDFIVDESISNILGNFQEKSGCEACTAGFDKCSTCYNAAKHTSGCDPCRTGTCSAQNQIPLPPRSSNPSPERLARLDQRPVPLGYNHLGSPVSVCPSLVEMFADENDDDDDDDNNNTNNSLWLNAETLASLDGSTTESEDDDVVQICEVTNLGLVHNGAANVVNVGSATNSECCSPSSIFPYVSPLTIVRLAVPSDIQRFYSLPSAGLPRPDSPTLPPEFPAPLFSKRK